MRFRATVPRLVTSTVEAEPTENLPILDGRRVPMPNVWRVRANGVVLCGRPAVWVALDVRIPGFSLGPLRVGPRRIRWEQDFGGHLYLVVGGETPADAFLLEGGPYDRGTGGLVPFAYPEAEFFNRQQMDFDPVPISPPSGMSDEEFVASLFRTTRAYDGDQLYTAIEIPFLRIGRDSNSYAIGVLLASGVDIREVPKPYHERRFEWSGYPGAEDPVHLGNFRMYVGEVAHLDDGTRTATYHDARGDVAFVVVAGDAHGTARLPLGAPVALDKLGRRVLAPATAHAHGLPTRHTPPPPFVRERPRFPREPAPAGAPVTFVVDGVPTELAPGRHFEGRIVERDDALALATMRTGTDETVVMPIAELGVEMRDPKRVDAALRVGNHVRVGLHGDRRPELHVAGTFDRPRSAAPLLGGARLAAALVAALALAGAAIWYARRA